MIMEINYSPKTSFDLFKIGASNLKLTFKFLREANCRFLVTLMHALKGINMFIVEKCYPIQQASKPFSFPLYNCYYCLKQFTVCGVNDTGHWGHW